jgi:ribosomal protein L11 methyltransferase
MLSGVYIELDVHTKGNRQINDLLTALLAEEGFDSFTEEQRNLQAFAPREQFNEERVKQVLDAHAPDCYWELKQIEPQNWNAQWEAQFEPIEINDQCRIRAPFHEPANDGRMELIIEPRMSFGTGHHATTRLVCQSLFTLDVKGKNVLDMGCGTGVLGILALKLGAASCVGIDIETWSAENAAENAAINGVSMSCLAGDASLLEGKKFDLILANINRNILVRDLPQYAASLNTGGTIVLSGFLVTDEPVIHEAYTATGLKCSGRREEEGWLCLTYTHIIA